MTKKMQAARRWRKIVAVFAATAVLSIGLPTAGRAAGEIKLKIDGQNVTTSPAPILLNDRTLVPVRLVSEKLGAEVIWNEKDRTVNIKKGSESMVLRIDNRLVEYKREATLYNICDVQPQIIDGRTFVPLRLVSNGLGADIQWDGASRTVVIKSGTAAAITPFFDMTIASVKPGQTINNTTPLQSAFPGALPANAAEIRYHLLDSQTGRGNLIARGTNITGSYFWLPEPQDQGIKVLAAGVYDKDGRFLAGHALPVQVAFTPQVSLTGVVNGQQVTDSLPLGAGLNFSALYVTYEITNQDKAKTFVTAETDPQGQYQWAPEVADSGNTAIRVIAYDRLGQAYPSPVLSVNVNVARKLELRGVTAGSKVDKPVTLWTSRNFAVSQTEYVLRDPLTGKEEILAQFGYGNFKWFPGPAQAGTKEVAVRIRDTANKVYTSEFVSVQVTGNPSLLLETVGPNEVLTGPVKLKSTANVSLKKIEYLLINTKTGARRVIAGSSDPTVIEYTWTPQGTDSGSWSIQAEGTMLTGEKVKSEAIPVRVFLGKLYGPVPIAAKDAFLELATGMALKAYQTTGMSAALQTAQAILETGWGQSTPADKYTGLKSNNLFGIKGVGPAGSVISNTWEEYNGNTFRIDANFRAYKNPADSWADHKLFLLSGARYATFRSVMHNSLQGAWALKRAGYATDSKYPLKLMDIITRYNLQVLDEITM